jgi:exopolysaccharide biosynthesis polyprenyl glycosylphosphotransferase
LTNISVKPAAGRRGRDRHLRTATTLRMAAEPSVAGRRRRSLLTVGTALTDVASLIAALMVSDAVTVQGHAPWHLVRGTGVWLATFALFGAYGRLPALEEIRRTAGAAAAGVGSVLVFGSLTSDVSPATAGSLWLMATGFVLLTRFAWRVLRRHPALSPRLALRTLIVGVKEEVAEATRLLGDIGSFLRPVGTFTIPSASHEENGVERLTEAIRGSQAECVVVASPALPPVRVAALVRAARLEGAEVRLTANLPEVLPHRVRVENIGSISLVSLSLPRLTGAQARLKRVLDLSLALAGIIIAAPLLAFIAAAIKGSSHGPILFRQERVTRGGRVFRMLKFRTMHQDGDQLLSDDSVDPTAPFFKLRHDPRLTSVGRFLRRISLDELPQLFNVVRGDMSLVGPRPLPAEQVAANPELLGPRHEVPAGITGWWQVKGRSDLDPEQAVRLDTFYIENWSLGLDLTILLRTVGAVLRRVGAY